MSTIKDLHVVDPYHSGAVKRMALKRTLVLYKLIKSGFVADTNVQSQGSPARAIAYRSL